MMRGGNIAPGGLALALLLCLAVAVNGDIYMHNPRGSNNRLNEPNVNRENNNRMCDTQVPLRPHCVFDQSPALTKQIQKKNTKVLLEGGTSLNFNY